jgi:hypothetical protein
MTNRRSQVKTIEMKKIIVIFIVLFIPLPAASQSIPYEKLDSLSTRISELQFAASGIVYEDGKDRYQLSFPTENFKIFVSNRKATNAVYKKNDGVEILELTENIDLTKATTFKVHEGNTEMAAFRMTFPEGSIQTKVYENGTLAKTKTIDYIDFFSNINKSKTNSSFNTWQLFNSLAYLVHSLKAEHGSFPYDIDELDKKWKETIDKYDRAEISEFIKTYKGTLYAAQGVAMLKSADEWDRERMDKRQWILNFADSLASQYKFKPDMAYVSYNAFNPAVAKVKLKYYDNGNYWGYPSASFTLKNFSVKTMFDVGFTGYMTDQYNKIISLSYCIHGEKGGNGTTKKILADLYGRIEKNTDPYFVKFEEKEDGNKQQIVIKVPVSAENTHIQYYITIRQITYDHSSGVTLSFSTKPNLATYY